jgi:AhpD family alkylhydroperoxidase
MARIDLPEAAGSGAAALDVARALTAAPHWVDVVVGYEKAVAASPLDPRLHELVRYRVAQLNACTLCLDTRREGSGVTEEELEQVATATTPGSGAAFSPLETDALRLAELFATDSTSVPDELLAALQRELGAAGVVDLVLVIGKYVAMGRFMQVLGLDQSCRVDPALLTTR